MERQLLGLSYRWFFLLPDFKPAVARPPRRAGRAARLQPVPQAAERGVRRGAGEQAGEACRETGRQGQRRLEEDSHQHR